MARTQEEINILIFKMQKVKSELKDSWKAERIKDDMEAAEMVLVENYDEDDINATFDPIDYDVDYIMLAVEWLEGNNGVEKELLKTKIIQDNE